MKNEYSDITEDTLVDVTKEVNRLKKKLGEHEAVVKACKSFGTTAKWYLSKMPEYSEAVSKRIKSKDKK